MARTGAPVLVLENSFARELEGLFVPWQAEPMPAPRLLTLNDQLARELGADPDALRRPEGVTALAGQGELPGATPIAQVYAGHQFGGYSPRLGDGRALLLGELIDSLGRRRDVHLKGSGPTPFARGGDGRAVVGPMLREHLVGEAMHALGVPTTRALAVVATGRTVVRDRPQPGAVLVRVAASHLRVGTFEYAARQPDVTLVRRLADYAIARHHPAAGDASNRYIALLEAVTEAQAALVARWMLVGFVHGVMNTDNTTISGETIDYGPCAFIDAFDPAAVFSSIDRGGRYAFGHQPAIVQWNLARLAETLLGLIDDDEETAIAAATEVLSGFADRYRRHWTSGMSAKLGLGGNEPERLAVIESGLDLLRAQRVDYTSFFRALAEALRGDAAAVRGLFAEPAEFDRWSHSWLAQVARRHRQATTTAAEMDRVNPVYIPRNHLVEAALEAAGQGDLDPFERLLDVVSHPFDERPDRAPFATPAPLDFGPYQTFCGT